MYRIYECNFFISLVDLFSGISVVYRFVIIFLDLLFVASLSLEEKVSFEKLTVIATPEFLVE
jgi:hypothetical protein